MKNHIIIASIIRAFIESHNFSSFSISTKCIFLLSNFKGNGREATFNNSNIPKSKSFVEKVFFTNNFQFCVFLLWPFAFWEKYETFPFLLMPELSYGNHFKLMNYLKALIPQNGKANNFRVWVVWESQIEH